MCLSDNKILKSDLLASILLTVFFLFSLAVTAIPFVYNLPIVPLVLKIALVMAAVSCSIWILFKIKTNIPFSIIFLELVYFLCGTAVLIVGTSSFIEFFWSFASLLSILIILNLVLLSRRVVNTKIISLFSISIVVVAVAACIFSDFVEAGEIQNAFFAKGEDSHFYQINSFLSNKNAYGFLLFFAITIVLFCFYKGKKTRIVLLPIYLYLVVNLIFSRCKIAIVSVALLSILCIVFLMIELYKKSRTAFILCASFLLLSVSLFLCLVLIPQVYSASSVLEALHNYFFEGFIGQASRSFITRFEQFNSIQPLFANPQIILGYGERIQFVSLNGVRYSISIDNSYASLILSGGIPKALLFLSALVFIYAYVHRSNIERFNRFFIICLCVCFLVYGMFESFSILGTSFYTLGWLFLIFVAPYTIGTVKVKIHKNEPMRILHVVGSFRKGGTEAFILNYLTEIRKHSNIFFDVYCFGDADEEQVEKLHQLGGQIYFGKSPSKKHFVQELFCFWIFMNRHTDYDIIHCSANFDNCIYLHVANLLDVNVRIQHAHDTLTGIEFSKTEKLINVSKRFVNNYNSSKTFACSFAAGSDITGDHHFEKQGKIIPNSISFESFSQLTSDVNAYIEKYGLLGKKVFGNISRFEQKKNQRFILDIFEKYHIKNKDSVLILGGVDGGELELIKSLAEKSSCKDAIKFIGPRSDVFIWLKIIDVYLMPSLFEGFGISAIEAQAAGAYVLASNNLPIITDLGIGRISYLLLDNTSDWLNMMDSEYHKDNLNISMAKYNIKNDYKILLEEYIIS